MDEQRANTQEKEEGRLRLADLDEEVSLRSEKESTSRRKRIFFVIIALLLLAAVTGVGAYFLLNGKQVDLKANKRLPEKTSSGSDIRQAAYDSISGSLTAPSPSPILQSTITEPASGDNQITPSLSDRSSGERVAAPITPGISATLAPPEVIAAKPTPQANASNQAGNAVSIKAPARLLTVHSVRFAALPPSLLVGSQNNSATPITTSRTISENNKPILVDRRANIPSFGAMLPVRLMGVLYTLRTGSLARFELMRDFKTDHWQMKRGTVFVGNVIGGGADRAFVQIKGFIDPATERLVKVEGEVLGDDGGAGLRGKRRRVSSVWTKALDRAAQAGLQIATSILNRGASSIIIATDPYGAIRPSPAQANDNSSFIEVPAGAVGFVMVTTLPNAIEPDSHLAAGKASQNDFADQELAELFTTADPAQIRSAMPRMTPELRQIAEMVVKEIEAGGR